MANELDLIANLTLAIIDLAGAVARIAETMPEHTKARINDSLNVAVTKPEKVAIAISESAEILPSGDDFATSPAASQADA